MNSVRTSINGWKKSEKKRAMRNEELNHYLSSSAEDTFNFARSFGSTLDSNCILCFFGDLGAGKTTFIKGVAAGVAAIDPRDVSSPTFNLLNIYKGAKTVYHFDLYRLKGREDFIALGFEEFFEQGICCIEWAERISESLPEKALFINMQWQDQDQRLITISRSVYLKRK
jgi:tRNA threonylcarbamoyladenosine biosynthesis protein TsaE